MSVTSSEAQLGLTDDDVNSARESACSKAGRLNDGLMTSGLHRAAMQFLIIRKHPVDGGALRNNPVCAWVVRRSSLIGASDIAIHKAFADCGCGPKDQVFAIVDFDRAKRKAGSQAKGRIVCPCMGVFVE